LGNSMMDQELTNSTENKIDNELISDEITDIISRKPHWIIRYGASLIGVILLLLMFIGWFVRYPQVNIAMEILITGQKEEIADVDGSSQSTLWKGEIIAAHQSIKNKINMGQSLLIEIKGYPSSEFGYLTGEVTKVSALLASDSSLIQVVFPQGMCTHYNKLIPIKTNTKTNAQLKTTEKRLIENFLSSTIFSGSE
jgi:hypothetical protein